MEHRTKFVGIALLCVAFGSAALTLGRTRGAVLIGQPLDLVIPVQLDAGEDAASLCFDAEVFHADTRQDASRVRVVVDAAGQGQMVNLRVLSSAVVDEPVVTVYLHSGCGQKTTRRYVLLADLPSEIDAPSVPLIAPAPNPAPAAREVTPTYRATSNLPAMTSASTPAAPVTAARAKPAPAPKPAERQPTASKRPDPKAATTPANTAPSAEKSKTTRTPGQPRLKLDSLEVLSNRVATLESSTPATPTEEALREIQRTQTLESDVKALLALAAKNEASLVDLKARLQKAESERLPDGLIYALIGLVLVSLAAVAWLWSRLRRIQTDGIDWRGGAVGSPAPAPVMPEVKTVSATQEADEARASKIARASALSELLDKPDPASEVDVSLVEMSESNFDRLMQSGAAHSAIRKQPRPHTVAPVVAPHIGARNFNSGAVFDVRQQAEFFISLGQADQAARILEKQITESEEPNPFVYLDLLNIFYSLNRKIDFRQFRQDFNLLFNGNVQDFASFKDEGKDLEGYPPILLQLTTAWRTHKAVDLIESCIFRDPWDEKGQPFDLAAFRDLLLLHAVANLTGSADIAAEPSALPSALINAQPGTPPEEVPLPHMLDLDLSDSEIGGLAASAAPSAEGDYPLLRLGETEAEATNPDPTRPPETDPHGGSDQPPTPKKPG